MKIKHLTKHQTKKELLARYVAALIILTIYTIYLLYRFGPNGISLSLITWSGFVMATPIADGGIIIDLPIRLLTKLKMIYSEIIVWAIAISLNIYYLTTDPAIYQKTAINNTFYQILSNPWPNWLIILISVLGTFLSLYFGDELLDVIEHSQRKKYRKFKNWQKLIWAVFVALIFYFFYIYLLGLFNLKI